MTFIIQRQLDNGKWFDAKNCEDLTRARRDLEFDRAVEQNNPTRAQRMRLVQVIA